MRILTSLLLTLVTALAAHAQTEEVPGWMRGEDIVHAELISSREFVAAGDAFHIGLHQTMPAGWHTYWRNPGDFGQPLELSWTLPEGVTVGDPIWPMPEELPLADGEIMDYGYHDEVVLPLPIQVSSDYAGATIEIGLEAYWQVCEVVCVPEERSLTLTLPVATTGADHPEDVWLIQSALDAEPRPEPRYVPIIERAGDLIILELSSDALPDGEWRNLRFLPFDADLIAHAVAPRVSQDEAGHTHLVLEASFKLSGEPMGTRSGLLMYERNQGGGIWSTEAVEISAEAGETSLELEAPMGVEGLVSMGTLSTLLLLALGGGLILNLMPCVFPILSIKVLKFVETAHHDPMQVRRHGLYFLAGVVLSFLALAGILVGLREFGLPVGWGFQLQLPVVVAILALLLFGIGLNLLGAFEVGTSIQGLGSDLAEAPGGKGAFFTGVLAVVVAAPCVGPLAAGALGLALTQPVAVVLLVAAAMGVGLALPFVVFTFAPALLRLLPRPGDWMVIFKQVLAFPMFAATLWLVWVLSLQAGPTGVLILGGAMLAFAFAVWSLKINGVIWRALGVVSLLLMAGLSVSIARLPAITSTQYVGDDHQVWSAEAVTEAQARGQAVFVDVTAAWCVTCQVNKLRVLNDPQIEAAFAEAGVVVMQADWTNRDDAITELIYAHGQAGVPLYLVYPEGGGNAVVLPSVLTRSIVLEAIEDATR